MKSRSVRGRGKRWKKVRASPWISLDHSALASLFCFANARIGEANWEGTLWDSLGREKFVRGATDEGPRLMFASDIDPTTNGESEVTSYIPKIAGEQATLERTVKLQKKVTLILTRLAGTVGLVYHERNGLAGTDRVERAKRRSASEGEEDPAILPSDFTHFKEHRAILDMIKREFNVRGARSATIVLESGSICFDDAGEDASNTLAWLLLSLVEAVFEEELPVLRRCLFCEKFFIHRTLRQKKFCSDQCRFNFHNKGLQGGDERG